jgi:hypothetical protein
VGGGWWVNFRSRARGLLALVPPLSPVELAMWPGQAAGLDPDIQQMF